MSKRTLPLALVLVLASLAVPDAALAGWHARERETGPGHPDGAIVDVYYDAGNLRIDQPEGAMIVDLRSGDMILVNNGDRTYVVNNVNDMAKMRDQMLANLPPEIRAKAQAQMKAAMKKAGVRPVPTGKKQKVGKWTCEIYTFKTPNASGEICAAKQVGVPLGDFVDQVKAFAERMQKSMGGPGAEAMMDMMTGSFPIRTKVTVKAGPNGDHEMVRTIESIEPMSVSADKFTPPSGFTKKTMEDMMREHGHPGPMPSHP